MQAESTPPANPPSRKRVTTACSPCRRIRAKCDGRFPCGTCSSKNTVCEYEQREDGRSKRAHEELKTKSEMLHTILHSLRTNNAQSNEELLNTIRDGATPDEIAQMASDLARRTERAAKRPRPSTVIAESQMYEPTVHIPAQPWTQVTEDDDDVSHLMSAYLTWQHSAYPAFDPKILVREAQSGQISSPYCSKFLINATLAAGCLFSGHPAALKTPDDASTRCFHYLEEATKLWELEEGRASLTNLQGLTLLIVAVVLLGRDRVALLYATQLNRLREDLFYIIRQSRKANATQYTSLEFQRSWSYAAWASFKLEVELSMAWRTSFLLFKPNVARPYLKDDLDELQKWRPYPEIDPEVEFQYRLVDDAGCELYEIGVEICSIILSGGPQDSPLPNHIILEPAAKLIWAQGIEHKLLAWHDELPTIPIGREELALPHLAGPTVNLQLTYNIWRIEVNGVVYREATTPTDIRTSAGQKIVAACKRVAGLLRYLQHTFGMLNFTCHTGHAASISAYNLLEFISQPEAPDLFHTMMVTLTAVSQRWNIARGIVKALWIKIKDDKLEDKFLDATVSLLTLNAVENWGPDDHLLFEKCTYPSYTNTGVRDITGIGDLLASYAQLDINRDVDPDIIQGTNQDINQPTIQDNSQNINQRQQ